MGGKKGVLAAALAYAKSVEGGQEVEELGQDHIFARIVDMSGEEEVREVARAVARVLSAERRPPRWSWCRS